MVELVDTGSIVIEKKPANGNTCTTAHPLVAVDNYVATNFMSLKKFNDALEVVAIKDSQPALVIDKVIKFQLKDIAVDIAILQR